MIIDHIEAFKFTDKDTPNFDSLQLEATYNKGSRRYTFPGRPGLDIWYNPNNGLLRLKGSIMYFVLGHNFVYSQDAFESAINYIGESIGVNLWDMLLDILEVGTIMQVNKPPQEYIRRHGAGAGQTLYENPKDKGALRGYNSKYVQVKLYDAGKNLKQKQGREMRNLIEKKFDWNPKGYYLKFEIHYIKPEQTLNRGIGIYLEDLLSEDWKVIFKEDIYLQYKNLNLMGDMVLQKCKKATTEDIGYILYLEECAKKGMSLAEVEDYVKLRLKEMPDLSKSNRCTRKKRINSIFNRIVKTDNSPYDLSNKLEQALQADPDEVEGVTPFIVYEK